MRKTCGNAVQIMRTGWVRIHNVCTNLGAKIQMREYKSGSFTHYTHFRSPAFPTAKISILTPVVSYFSPLSTGLIITTTKVNK